MGTNDSKYHMIRGLIALAWADDVLDPNEVTVLAAFMDKNIYLTPEQREQLKKSIRTPISIFNVWDQITDIEDRTRLINMAGVIFYADGEFCPKEKKIYDQMLAMHLGDINRTATEREIAAMTKEVQSYAAEIAKKQERNYNAQMKKNSEKTPSKIGLLIYRINTVMSN